MYPHLGGGGGAGIKNEPDSGKWGAAEPEHKIKTPNKKENGAPILGSSEVGGEIAVSDS